ncbi:YrbL family protein [Vibrio rumoiensis]|uniref:YrbL family protein n=1 Tax=Vibrio rumoiensis TaxID=76258 RepID=UPI0037498946
MNDDCFLNWRLIGQGNERFCYLDPIKNNRCIKVSKLNRSKQSKREIRYFSLLKKRKVPFLLIPEFYGVIRSSDYLGIEQEVILNSDGSSCENVEGHIERYCKTESDELRLLNAMNELKLYLLMYNIIPCDLMLSNILIKIDYDTTIWKAYLIDGFGSAQVIPYHDYIPFLGRKKIERKWNLFIHKRVKPLLKYI